MPAAELIAAIRRWMDISPRFMPVYSAKRGTEDDPSALNRLFAILQYEEGYRTSASLHPRGHSKSPRCSVDACAIVDAPRVGLRNWKHLPLFDPLSSMQAGGAIDGLWHLS